MTEGDEQRQERREDDAEGAGTAAEETAKGGDERPPEPPAAAAEPPANHPLPGPRTAWDADAGPAPRRRPDPVGPPREPAADASKVADGTTEEQGADAGAPVRHRQDHPADDTQDATESSEPGRLAWPRPRQTGDPPEAPVAAPAPGSRDTEPAGGPPSPPTATPTVPAPPPAEPSPDRPDPEPPPPAPAGAEGDAATAPPQPDLDDSFFADLASGALTSEQDTRSYRELVRQVDSYRAEGYDLYGLVGYPKSGKTHALKALTHRLQGFDPSAREHFRRERAPVPTEAWPFYYAYTGSAGERWVFMDPGGELFAKMRSNDWELAKASSGLLHTIGHCKGIFLMLHLRAGHLGPAASGFAREMDEHERKREVEAQEAQEELEFFDQFLLFARALAAEKGDVAKLVRSATDSDLDEALRPYRSSPRLEAPVAVLFTQADLLAGGKDFAGAEGTYVAPQSKNFRTVPFVARNLPTLLSTLLRHCRRFRFDFAQSYVEKPGVGEGLPLWSYGQEPLSVGLVAALEFLLRRAPQGGGASGFGRFAIDTRTALRLHRLLHPQQWEGIEVDL